MQNIFCGVYSSSIMPKKTHFITRYQIFPIGNLIVSLKFANSYETFTVPPQIHPFSFGNEAVNSGDLVSVTCAIFKGDLPINISWTLNGLNTNILEGVATGSMNRKTSQLTIESAQAHHSGEYTCIAENSVGLSKYSSYLNVNGIVFHLTLFLKYFFIYYLHQDFSRFDSH